LNQSDNQDLKELVATGSNAFYDNIVRTSRITDNLRIQVRHLQLAMHEDADSVKCYSHEITVEGLLGVGG
jgi:hypothetical protein